MDALRPTLDAGGGRALLIRTLFAADTTGASATRRPTFLSAGRLTWFTERIRIKCRAAWVWRLRGYSVCTFARFHLSHARRDDFYSDKRLSR